MNSKNSITTRVYFENVTVLSYFHVHYCLKRGYEVSLFDFKGDLKRIRWLKTLINNGRVKLIYIQDNNHEHGEAIDLTEPIYSRFKNSRLVRYASSLYETDEVENIFKKVLVTDLFECLYMNAHLSNVEKSASPTDRLIFVPIHYKHNAALISRHSGYPLDPLHKIKFSLWGAFYSFCAVWSARARYLAVLAYIFYSLLTLIIASRTRSKRTVRESRKYFPMAIAIDMEFQGRIDGDRGASFILNGTAQHGYIFLINQALREDTIRNFREKGYVFLETKNKASLSKFCSGHYDTAFIKKALKSLFNALLQAGANLFLLRAYTVGLLAYTRWNTIFGHVSFANYLYTNQESAGQIAANILLRKRGCVSWNYSFFLGGGYIFALDSSHFHEVRHILWSFLNPDYFVNMNEDCVSYYKLHRQSVRKYYSIGCVYSETIKNERRRYTREDFISKHFRTKHVNAHKIISFFDTSFVDSKDVMTNYEECMTFYQDIIRLLDSDLPLLIVVKPSKLSRWFTDPDFEWSSPEKGKVIMRLWDRLKSHERVFWASVPRNEIEIWNFTYNNLVLAMSDVVVTHCMSTPTAEALGARKKAMWYESGDKHRGIMYDQIPGLCVHGYAELIKRLKFLLYEVTDEEYDEYLDKYIKGKIDSHADGLALTRFRELLGLAS